MKISIITVCFNAKNTIEETFLSISEQTHKDVELIVIDGNSTDGTLEVINKYRKNISHFVSERDDGIYGAMNKGIDFVNGDFILFLNANDVLYNEHVLETVSKVLDENPDTKFLFGDVDYISTDKKTSTIQTYENVKNAIWFINENICHQSIFYHKSLFKKFGHYSKDYKIYSDWDFNIKCLVKNKVQALYLPIIISKFQLGGLSSNRALKKIYKNERNALIEQYYPKSKFFIYINDFFKKNLRALYKFFINNYLIIKLVNLYSSQNLYKLNIKKVENN